MAKRQKLEDDPEVIRLIYAMAWDPRYSDMTLAEIGARWGLTGTAVSNIKVRKTHRDITEGMLQGRVPLQEHRTTRKRRSRTEKAAEE